MCLLIDHSKSPPTTILQLYKVMIAWDAAEFFLKSPYQNMVYLPGENVAEKCEEIPFTLYRCREGSVVQSGALHAYYRMDAAQEFCNCLTNPWSNSFCTSVIVPVTGLPADFVAWGRKGDIAYRKLIIFNEHYQAAIQEAKCKLFSIPITPIVWQDDPAKRDAFNWSATLSSRHRSS